MKDAAVINYVRDLSALVCQMQKDAADDNDGFESGRRFAFFEIVSLMQQQADAFGIQRSDLGLPEKDVDPQ